MNSRNSNPNVGLNDPIVAKDEESVLLDTIVNAGKISREDSDHHRSQNQEKRFSFPDRRPNGGSNFKVKRYSACGLINKELHHAVRTLHTCEPGTCFIQGPKFNNHKEIRENVNQFNLKNVKDKGATPEKID